MKRVLNSGTIKLPYFKGTEKERLDTFRHGYAQATEDDLIKFILTNNPAVFNHMQFKFEIKAPLLIFNVFQRAHLGILTQLTLSEDQSAYLPPQFFKRDGLDLIPMDSKSCNELNTKLNNFYNWSFNFYGKLLESGLCNSQADLVLPQGMFVNFLWDITAKDLITFIEDNYNKSPEIYGYCSILMLYLEEHLPLVTRWLKANRWQNISL